MPQFRIERPSAVEGMIPDHGVIVPVLSARIGLLVYLYQHLDVRVEVFVIIQFVEMIPDIGQVHRRWMVLIHDDKFCLLLLGMRFEVAAHQVPIPLKIIFTIRRRMDPDEAAAVMDIFLKVFFFVRTEYLTRRAKENEGLRSEER